MKKIITIFLVLIVTATLWAYDFQSGDLYYNITSDITVEVTYQKYPSLQNYQGLTSVTIPSTVTYNGTTYSVTSIGKSAFWWASLLASITIPNSVTNIGDEAFYSCSSLTSITIPNSVTSIGYSAFRNCSSLTSITIPNSVTSLENSVFHSCSSLTSVSIGNCVTSIGGSAFAGCSSLTSVTIPNSVTSIGYEAFAYCSLLTSVTIGNSVTSIRHNAFYDCSSLTSITIPNSVTSVGEFAFSHCSSLTSIVVETGNTTYDSRDNCNAIIETATNTLIVGCKNTVIPNSVTSIRDDAFYKCSSLKSITIPNSVINVEYGAFAFCSSLESMIVEGGNTKYDSRDNCNAIIETTTNTLIAGCQNTTIPNSVTSIGPEAFYACTSLTFIIIPNNVMSIGDWAFGYCSSLASVTLGNSVTSIGEDAFEYCFLLDSIYCYATTPPNICNSTFDDEEGTTRYGATLYVSCDVLKDYEAHEVWGKFTNVQCISSEKVETDKVIITTGSTEVVIIWPIDGDADTYTIVIKKDGEVVCTLTFNAEGQLLNIAFAPGRDGNHPVQYAEAVANGKGFRFTVTGLEEGIDYTYDIIVKDSSNKTINSYSGKFTTEPYSAVDNTYSQSSKTNCQKLLRNGQLIIVRDGIEYNAMGQEL